MADENKARIVLDGDVSPLRQKLREAAADLKRVGDDGANAFGRMTGPMAALQSKFVALGAILAGGAVFQEAVRQTQEWTEQSVDLSAAIGITAAEASNLKAALAEENVEVSAFMGAAQKLASNLKNDEQALNAVGLATRDAAGNLRPLNDLTVDAIELLGDYKAGTDRAVAASTLFGKGFELTGDLAKINSQLIADVTARQKELGAVLTDENVAAFDAYDGAMKDATATTRGIMTTIGNVLMPVLADLANWFVSIGPAAIVTVRGALGGLAATFHFVTLGVRALWETLAALVKTMAAPIAGMSSAISRAMAGDWEGAGNALKGVTTDIETAWSDAFETMADKAQATRDKVWNLFAEGTPAGLQADAGGRSAAGLVKTDPEKKKKGSAAEKSSMPEYEAELDALRLVESEKNALRQLSKAEELAYWNTVLQQANVTAKDRMAIERKVTDLTLEKRRQEAQQSQSMEAEVNRAYAEQALGRIAIEQAAMEAALANEEITKSQALAMETEFENRRYMVRVEALQKSLALAAQDPNTSPEEKARIQNEMLALEQQHQVSVLQLQGQLAQAQKQAAAESGQIWKDLSSTMSSLWDQGVEAMMNGTFRWSNAFKAIGAQMASWFANSVVGAMLRSWIAGKMAEFAISLGLMTKEKAIKLGFLAQETAAQATGSAAVVGMKTAEATTVVAANAVEAGSGAAASQASIPYIGPILAIAAMAAIFAAVSGMGSKVKSARRGYSVPRGVNPMMQIHEEEQVLPKDEANVFRSLKGLPGMLASTQAAMAEGGAGGNSVTYNDHSGRLTRDQIRENARVIAEELNRVTKRGWSAS